MDAAKVKPLQRGGKQISLWNGANLSIFKV